MDKVLRFLLWGGGVAALLIGAGRLLLFEPWTIPHDPFLAASIAPTLRAGDTVLVLTVGQGGFGDLVRCPDPDNPGDFVVGRIVGLGGDVVEVQGRSLRVNDTRYNATEACKEPTFFVEHPDSGSRMEMQCARVELGGGWHFRGQAVKYDQGNDQTKQVGQGKVYLLSDNRDFHDDSRDFGTLPEESCAQRVVFRLWGAGGWKDSERRMDVIR